MYYCMIETSLLPPWKSLVTFSNLRKCSESGGKSLEIRQKHHY